MLWTYRKFVRTTNLSFRAQPRNLQLLSFHAQKLQTH